MFAKLSEQMQLMYSTTAESANDLTSKLDEFKNKQENLKERNRDQEAKIEQIHKTQTSVREKLSQLGKAEKNPVITQPSSKAATVQLNTRLKSEASRALSKLTETEIQTKTVIEKIKIQDVRSNAVEFQFAAVAVKMKENEQRVEVVRSAFNMAQSTSKRRDEALSTISNHGIDTKATTMRADTDLDVLQSDVDFTNRNIERLNEKIPEVKNKMAAIAMKMDAGGNVLGVGGPGAAGGGQLAGTCPRGYFKRIVEVPDMDSYIIRCRDVASEEAKLNREEEKQWMVPNNLTFL